MTVVEKRDSSPEGAQQGEEIDLLDHGALIQDMNKSDKLSLEERAKKARKNRRQQLKLFAVYDRAEEERTSAGDNRTAKIRFPHDVALMDAASKGAIDDMKNLLEKGLDPNAKNQEGLTALHNSCIDGNPDIVNLLLKHGASVNVSDKDGWTPLHAAATCGYPKVVKTLIAAGADLLAINGDGDMPYDIADDEETLGLIEDAMRTTGVTNDTIEEKRKELHAVLLKDAKTLIDEKEDLDIPVNEEGATLLHVAIANNFNDVVEVLLDNGASVGTQDIEGWKPVHAAAFFGNEDALEMLVLKKGADLRATTDSGLEPLDLVDQPTVRKNILTLMDADQNKYKVENKKPIERGSTTPHILEESTTDTLVQNESASDENTDTILPAVGESLDNEGNGQILASIDENDDFKPVLKRVESISTKRNSMREAKKQAPTIKSSNTTRKNSLDVYDNSYDLLLTKKKPGRQKPKEDSNDDLSFSSVQTLGKIYENDDRSEDSNDTNEAIEVRLETKVLASLSEDDHINRNTPSTTSDTSNGGTILQISAEYGNLLETRSTQEEKPAPVFMPPSVLPAYDTDPADLPISPFRDDSSSTSSDNKNDLVLPSETASTASSIKGNNFLDELTPTISPKMVNSHEQNAATAVYENGPPIQSTTTEDSSSTSASESGTPSTSIYENDILPPSFDKNDPPAKTDQRLDQPSKILNESTAQTQSLYEEDTQASSENEPSSSTLYENTDPNYHLYEDVMEVASSSEKPDIRVSNKTRPNDISTDRKEPVYAVVEKAKNDSNKTKDNENTTVSSSSRAAALVSNIETSSTTSGSVSSGEGTSTPKTGGTSNSNQAETSSPQPVGVSKESNRDSTVPSSPPPVPLRKKFDPLLDKRVRRSAEPVRPGTLQELKLKRQQSRQTLLLDDDELSPVISRGLESMAFRGTGQMPLSSTVTYRPPDSPSRNRKVYKAPKESKDTNIFVQKKRCNVM